MGGQVAPRCLRSIAKRCLLAVMCVMARHQSADHSDMTQYQLRAEVRAGKARWAVRHNSKRPSQVRWQTTVSTECQSSVPGGDGGQDMRQNEPRSRANRSHMDSHSLCGKKRVRARGGGEKKHDIKGKRIKIKCVNNMMGQKDRQVYKNPQW